jgi:hypothetical protein
VSHTETRVLTRRREVILVSGDGKTNDRQLREIAVRLRQETGAFIIVDHTGTMRLDQLDVTAMREHGWVPIDQAAAAEPSGAPA